VQFVDALQRAHDLEPEFAAEVLAAKHPEEFSAITL
jgi:hypothetical protein